MPAEYVGPLSDDDNSEDDLETLEEEERLALLHRESSATEIQELEDVRGGRVSFCRTRA